MADHVLIVGAGPVGSALALDLARRNVRVRIVDRSDGPFEGSRAKGVQPRTQEVFEDLGVLDELLAGSSPYPKLGIHLGPFTLPHTMIRSLPVTTDTPYPNTVLSPQSHTDGVLHAALVKSGVRVEYNRQVISVKQDPEGVTTALADGDIIRSTYLVGTDGASSTVRKQIGATFTGTTDEEDHMIIADVTIPGLRRHRWHIWPGSAGRFLGACPLPDGERFQVMLRLPQAARIANESSVLQDIVREALAKKRLTAGDFSWVSLFRPNIRLADHYRNRRVFLAGDAAHAHTPAGGQGLNTGVQDAYNLGWKLDAVLHGAPEALLDTYEAERRPVAARVLKLSTDRYKSFETDTKAATTRGEEERQLLLNYRTSPLAGFTSTGAGTLRAGDRLPDGRDVDDKRVFASTAGPDLTVLAIGGAATSRSVTARAADWPRIVHLPSGSYGTKEPTLILVRPDGYIAAITPSTDPEPIDAALESMRGRGR